MAEDLDSSRDEHERCAEALKKSEERYRLVARATGEAIWDNDLIAGSQEWAGATEALFGYPPHHGRTGEWWEERIHPEDRGKVLSGLDNALKGSGEAWSEKYRFRRANGTYAHVADRGYVVRDNDGKPVRMVGAMADVSEHHRADKELRERARSDSGSRSRQLQWAWHKSLSTVDGS